MQSYQSAIKTRIIKDISRRIPGIMDAPDPEQHDPVIMPHPGLKQG